MTEEEVLKNVYSMPLTSPAFANGPSRFVDREFLILTYRTDPEALARVVPAPLTAPDPVVKFEFIHMPDSSGFGDYTESGQVIPVTFKGEAGGYTHCMYLDNFPAIAAGREIMGYPKMDGSPKLEVRGDCLVATLDHRGVRLATATMAYKYRELDKAAVAKTMEAPGYLVKVIPHIDRSHRICEIVKFKVGELNVKGAWSGPATLELHPHVLAPVAALPVREILSAIHVIADLTLGDAEIVHDYLAQRPATLKARKAG
jgi:acetoacetate decarboxylase